jgi:hypothetical protein
LDELGGYGESPSDGDEGRDTPVVRLIAVWAAWEEEVTVDLVRVSLELLLEGAVSFVALLSFKSMGDFATVDGGDETVSNRADRLIEVRLGGEDVDRSLRRYGGVVWGELGDSLLVDDGVKRDREDGRGRRSGGGRLIGEVDGGHSIVEEGEVGVDVVGEVSVGVELQH